jgi:hypothetical protein
MLARSTWRENIWLLARGKTNSEGERLIACSKVGAKLRVDGKERLRTSLGRVRLAASADADGPGLQVKDK